MPKKPDVTPTLNIDIDTDAKYVIKLVGLDEQPSQFENSKAGDMSLVWKFRMTNQETGEDVVDHNSNELYELWQFTSDATYRNEKTGKVAKAREWAEALLGKTLSDDEVSDLIDDGFAEGLLNRRAVADVEWYTTKGGNERLKIIRLKPFRAKGKPAPVEDDEDETPAPRPLPQAAAIPPVNAKARKDLGLDDEDELPVPVRRERAAA